MVLKVVRIGTTEKGKVFEDCKKKVKVFESVKEKVRVFGDRKVKKC